MYYKNSASAFYLPIFKSGGGLVADKTDGKKLVVEIVLETKKAIADAEDLSEKLEDVEKKTKSSISEKFGKNFAGGVNIAVASLRAFDSIFPNTISGLEEIVKQATAAKDAMAAGASAPIAWLTSLISIIGIVAEMITSTGEKLKKEREEARQKAAEAADASKSERAEVENLAESYVLASSKLSAENATYSEIIDAKRQLLDLQNQLIEKYGDEAKSIDLINGNIEENIKLLREKAVSESQAYIADNESQYQKAKKELSNVNSYQIEDMSDYGAESGALQEEVFNFTKNYFEERNNKIEEEIQNGNTDLQEIIFGSDKVISQNLEVRIATGQSKKELEYYRTALQKFEAENPQFTGKFKSTYKKISEVIGEIEKGGLEDNQKTVAEYEKNKQIIDNNGKDLYKDLEGKAYNQQINENIDALNELSKAYKSVVEGGEMDEETLTALCAKYPEIAEYINQTGDKTLDNGAIIKKVYDDHRTALDEATQAEIQYLKEQGNSDDEIKELTATHSLYDKQIEEGVDVIAKYNARLSDLSSAYKTVSEGGELNSETLQSLSEQYPEIAKYIEETGDATLNNGKLLEDAYKSEQDAAKKAIYAEMQKLNILIANGEATDNQKKKYDELRNTISLYTGDMLSLQDTIDIYTGKMSDLSSAYKTVSEGGELDAKTLQSLCEKYPDLANYISETGDLTLKNGEKIKEAYENEKKLLIEKLTEKKKELELEKEDSANKEKAAKELAQVNSELEICNNLQLEASEQELNWSNISSEVKNLASAYQTLNEGKQLDIDTMISLIDKYPEVAAAMAKEGQLGKDQAEVLKQIFEAKKKEYILTQQNIIANRQSSEEDKKAAQARLKAIENYNIDSSKQSGGNTDDSNKALANELKQLEHKKAIGQLNSQQEYNWLVRINNKYRKNADEQSDMEKRLYNAKKQMQADEEAANTKALQEAYKGIENKKSLGKMNSQQELRQLEQIRQRYKMTAEERMELEIKIYNLKKSLKDDEISSINTLADAVTEALKQKYEEQRKLEEDRINESIESWQNWEDKTVSAIQGEIDALDELAKKQDSENKRQEYENKRQQTELQLAYEKDDYNRTQLQKELARLDKEEAERLAEEQREAKKKALEGRIEAVKGQSQATQERLNKELDKLGEKYEKLTDSFSLKAQAQKFIADSTQKQIISLIKSYASDYEIAGNTIGDALYNGMKAKMDNISAYVDGVFGKIEAYQRQMANTANASADRFWASQNSAQSAKKQSSQKAVTVKQTVNFNQPIESPVETRRQLDRTNQALAQQISNGI